MDSTEDLSWKESKWLSKCLNVIYQSNCLTYSVADEMGEQNWLDVYRGALTEMTGIYVTDIQFCYSIAIFHLRPLRWWKFTTRQLSNVNLGILN